VRLYESVPNPDWVSISQCLAFLDDAPEVAKVLDKLLKGSEVPPPPSPLPHPNHLYPYPSVLQSQNGRITIMLEGLQTPPPPSPPGPTPQVSTQNEHGILEG